MEVKNPVSRTRNQHESSFEEKRRNLNGWFHGQSYPQKQSDSLCIRNSSSVISLEYCLLSDHVLPARSLSSIAEGLFDRTLNTILFF